MKLIKPVFMAILVLAINACSQKLQKQKAPAELIIYPSPPDATRIQYLTSISTSKDIEGKPSAFKKYITGEEPPKPIIKPYGIAMHKGKIYICDLDLRGLEIIDLENQTLEYFIPEGMGQLKLPVNCFVDSLGYLYVADVQRHQVVIYDNNLQYVNSFGTSESLKPTDVFVADNKIWVANVSKGSIDVYKQDSTYQFLYSLPETTQPKEKLFQPTNLFVSPDKVYVSDFGEFSVKVYDHQGKFIQSIGSYGRNLGQFTRPKGIAVDKEENIYVVDAAFENVQIFNKEGKLLMFFGGSYKKPGGMWLPAKVIISYNGLAYFQKYVDKRFLLKYLIFVTNNFGPDKVNVYGYVEEKVTVNN